MPRLTDSAVNATLYFPHTPIDTHQSTPTMASNTPHNLPGSNNLPDLPQELLDLIYIQAIKSDERLARFRPSDKIFAHPAELALVERDLSED